MRSKETAGGIILFDSIHFVLVAEKLFKAKGVWIDIVPIPKTLSADCGMGIAFRPGDLDQVRETLAGAKCRERAIYMHAGEEYKEVSR